MSMRRLTSPALVAIAVAGATVLAALLIGASLLTGTEKEASAQPAPVPAAVEFAESNTLLAGIPQDGIVLGSPKAPITLVEFADLQCPYCAAWARDAFPTVVDEYVRTGKVRLVFRGMAFIGPESETALRASLAAGTQGRLWQVVHGLFTSQGAENGGWVTEGLLRSIGRGAGLDPEKMLALTHSSAVDRELAAAESAARRFAVRGTPSFQAGPTGGTLQPLHVNSLDADTFRTELERLLAA